MNNLIRFLNSNFGIWLLSSVMLGGISFSYSLINNKYIEELKKDASISRLRIEVAQRIDQVAALMREFGDRPESDVKDEMEEFIDIILVFLNPPGQTITKSKVRIYAGFQEFNNRPLRSLLVELLILDVENRKSIKKLLKWTTEQTRADLVKLDVEDIEEYIKTFADSIEQDYWDIDLGLFHE